MSFRPRDILYIEWGDTAEDPGWISMEDIDLDIQREAGSITSVGMFVKEDEDFITITNSFTGSGTVNSPLSIRKSAIENIYTLETD